MRTTCIHECNQMKKDEQVNCTNHAILGQINGTGVQLVRTGTGAVDEENRRVRRFRALPA